MSELKPCPFCGSEPTSSDEFDDEVLLYGCTSDIDCPLYDAPFVNLANWNTRPIEDALRARIAELEAESERFTVHSDIERQDDKWIPVSERLPEEDTDGNTLMAICRHSGEWVRAPFGAEFADEFVRHYSHWMNAPKLPEVQE